MSHRRTVIEPAEGLTVLVGPNNCGKSAVVVALQCMNTCDNRSAPFVRHGQKEARVVVDTSEGSRVEWIRGKNYTNYKINGREMTRARRPEDLDDHLRLAQVESEDSKRTFDLHFAEQKNPIFLLNESGAAAATFFAASSDAAYLVQMQSLLKRKESEARTRRRDLEARIDRQRKQLAAFETLANIEAEAKQAQELHAELALQGESIRELQRLRFSLEEAAIETEACRADLDALGDVAGPPEQQATEELARFAKLIEQLEFKVNQSADRATELEPLSLPPEVTDTAPMASTIEILSRKQKAYKKLADKTAISAQAPKPPDIDDTAGLKQYVQDLSSRLSQFQRMKDAAALVEIEHADAKRRLLEYVTANPTCPVCGSTLSADRILTESGS